MSMLDLPMVLTERPSLPRLVEALSPNNIVMDTLARETADPTRLVDVWIQGGLLLQDPRALPPLLDFVEPTLSEQTLRALLDALEMLPRTKRTEITVDTIEWSFELEGLEVRVWHDGGLDDET